VSERTGTTPASSLFRHRPVLMAAPDDPLFVEEARRWATQAAADLRDHTRTSRSEYTTQSVTNWMPALCQYVVDLAARADELEDAIREILDISSGWCAPMPDSERLALITTMGMDALARSKDTDASA